MSALNYEVAVVGAGVIGSWAAVHLAEKGVKTVLLEQVGYSYKTGVLSPMDVVAS